MWWRARYPACSRASTRRDVEHLFDRLVIPRLRTLDVSRVASQVLDILTEGNRHQPLLDRGLSAAETWLSDNVDLIKAKFSEASKFTPAPLDAYIVNKFVEGIIALIHEVVANPEHELRRQFDGAVQDLSSESADLSRFIAGLAECCCATAFGILKRAAITASCSITSVRTCLPISAARHSVMRDMLAGHLRLHR